MTYKKFVSALRADGKVVLICTCNIDFIIIIHYMYSYCTGWHFFLCVVFATIGGISIHTTCMIRVLVVDTALLPHAIARAGWSCLGRLARSGTHRSPEQRAANHADMRLLFAVC